MYKLLIAQGVYTLPVEFNEAAHVLEVYAVPSICHPLILGVDFFRKFGVTLNSRNCVWKCNAINVSQIAHRKIYDFHSLANSEVARLE